MENNELIKNYNDMRDKLEDESNLDMVEAGIIDNKFCFTLRNVKYRVSKLTFGQKQELNKARVKKFNELMKDSAFMLKDDLKKQYKTKGIDIDELEEKNLALESKKKTIKEKLGELLSKQASESECRELKQLIIDIEEIQYSNVTKLTELYEFSIENQMLIFSYSYVLMLCVEIYKEDKWVRFWNNYEEFSNTEEQLVNEIAMYASFVVKDEAK